MIHTQVDHLTVALGGRTILRDVSLSLPENAHMMVLGPNGAGKSTLLRAVSCVVPSQGEIRLRGQDLRVMSGRERARHVAVVSQSVPVSEGYTVGEVAALGRYAHRRFLHASSAADDRLVDEALDTVGILPLKNRRITSLSGGERQKAFLAQALCQQPELLLLDEPCTALDLKSQKQFYETVDAWRKQPGHAVISVVHDLLPARRYATRVLLVADGTALQGTPEEMFAPEKLDPVWGMDVSGYLRELSALWQTPAEP